MSTAEDTPPLDFGEPLAAARTIPVLICAGRAFTTKGTDGIRLVEIGAALELGRERLRENRSVARFETDDPHMSRSHALLSRNATGAVTVRDLGSRNGVLLNGEPLSDERALRDGCLLFIGSHVFVYRLMSPDEIEAIQSEWAEPLAPVPTMSAVLARISARLRRLARSRVDLLLGGETGVGKEVFAEAIHRESGRPGPLIAINCAALPETLLESELFGYARGAHSMADQSKAGLIEQAEGGTLFLDEIGEMSQSGQSKLLRFLQDRMLTPLGSTRPRRMDVRVIAATRRPVALSDTDTGVRFDLATRLGPEPLMLPPLRARPEDIGLLARYFLRDHPRSFGVPAFRSLFLHRWPGNVRELVKTMQLAAVLSEPNTRIEAEHLPFAPEPDLTTDEPSRRAIEDGSIPLDPDLPSRRPTSERLTKLLGRHHGNVADVARDLGRQRTLVWRWLRQEGLDPERFRSS